MMTAALILILLTLGHRVSSQDNKLGNLLDNRLDNKTDNKLGRFSWPFQCPYGHVVHRIVSYNNEWSVVCRSASRFTRCHWSGYIYQNNNYYCSNNHVIAGVKTFRWYRYLFRRFRCCSSGFGSLALPTHSCRDSLWLNSHNFYWKVPGGYYVTGVSSYHNLKRFRYCKAGDTTVCGVPAIKPVVSGYIAKIINGQNAVPGSWPWQVSLQRNGQQNCGGSLITRDWVLTAAHCGVKRLDRVILGEYNLRLVMFGEEIQNKFVSKVITHPYYNSDVEWNNDVALLKLSTPAEITSRVSPVCLSTLSVPSGESCVTTGWGRTSQTSRPDILQQVALPIVSQAQCRDNQLLREHGNITDTMICAGGDGATPCHGDSGGPLVCQSRGVWSLVGVVSGGDPRCDVDTPGVYARVSYFRSWILGTMAYN